jgi:hypothetical protein
MSYLSTIPVVYESLLPHTIFEKQIYLCMRFIQSRGCFGKIGQQLIRPTDLAHTPIKNTFGKMLFKFLNQTSCTIKYDITGVDI